MKLRTDNLLPDGSQVKDPFLRRLLASLTERLRESNKKVNALAEGRINAAEGTATAAPSGGEYTQGDFVRNSAPAEAGTAGSKYVITGWLCVASGNPGTWVECRALTGG